MKRTFLCTGLLLFCSLLVLDCQKKPAPIILSKDDPAYTLGKSLAEILPVIDPDTNQILATCKQFDLSAGDVLVTIRSTMGKQSDELIRMDQKELGQLVRQTVHEMAEKRLLFNAARKRGVKSTPAEVDSILQMQHGRAGGKALYNQFLTDSGIDSTFLRDDIVRSLIISKWLDQIVREQIPVSRQELERSYYVYANDTTVTVRHILLLTQDKSDSEKRAIRRKMERILEEARAGQDFSELVARYSEDPGSKDRGGLYENFNRGVMVKPFEQAAFTVPVGQISDIVETRYGYHILKVIRRGAGGKSLEDAREELEEKIRAPRRRQVIADYVAGLTESADLHLTEF